MIEGLAHYSKGFGFFFQRDGRNNLTSVLRIN